MNKIQNNKGFAPVRRLNISILLIILTITLVSTIGCKDNPVDSEKPVNHRPVISSVVMFPEVVNPSDSIIVICNASDPDGDTLVYDWYSLSGAIVKFKGGNNDYDIVLYNTHQNTQIIYTPESRFVNVPLDTFWLQCGVRDLKGGMDLSNRFFFVVRKDV